MGRLHELCSFSNFIETKMDQKKLGKSFPAQKNAEIGEGVRSMWESGAAHLGFDTTRDLSWSFLAVGCLVSL